MYEPMILRLSGILRDPCRNGAQPVSYDTCNIAWYFIVAVYRNETHRPREIEVGTEWRSHISLPSFGRARATRPGFRRE